MRKAWLACLATALAATRAAGLRFATEDLRATPADPLPPLDPAEAAPFPAWVPEASRAGAAGGRTNVLGLSVRWHFAPPPGRPGILLATYSNRLGKAFLFPAAFGPHGSRGPSGMLLFRVEADGSRTPLGGFPECEAGAAGSDLLLDSNATLGATYVLPAPVVSAAGAGGLAVAYAGVDGTHCVPYWADPAPLAVPPQSSEPGVAGTNEWAQLLATWTAHHDPWTALLPADVLAEYPEFAPYFPGVVLDATLPEAFRLDFVEWMPGVRGYDPAVFAFVTNAVDKTSPVVIAALRVLSRVSGATHEQKAVVRAMGDAVRAMSEDAQYPLLFRLHAARLFSGKTGYEEFVARTEPHLKLLAADELRGVGGRDFPDAARAVVGAGLAALTSDTTPFVAGPLAGKYPENATVGQVAAIILADLQAMWTAEPYEER